MPPGSRGSTDLDFGDPQVTANNDASKMIQNGSRWRADTAKCSAHIYILCLFQPLFIMPLISLNVCTMSCQVWDSRSAGVHSWCR